MESEKILDHTVFDYSNSAIIKPPFKQASNHEIGKQFTRLVIDSRDRDIQIYPSPNKYAYIFDQDIDEVTSAEIIIMDVPLSSYIINTNNNTLIVNNTKIIIPPGNYNGLALATVLQDCISQLIDGATVQYNEVQDNLSFGVGLVPYTIDFTSSSSISLAKIFGFLPGKLYTAPLTCQFRVNLNVNNYIILNIDQFNINVSTNTNIDRTTALVHYKPLSVNYISYSNMYLKKYFNPPVRLNKLKFTFTDYYGNLYDFQNQDHRIEIVFESKKNLGRYTHYV